MSTLTPKTVSFIITIGETQNKDVAKRGMLYYTVLPLVLSFHSLFLYLYLSYSLLSSSFSLVRVLILYCPFPHSPLSENITPLENQIVELAAGISGIQAEQDYMKIREQAHRNSTHLSLLFPLPPF
jgi:hypothetical protein